jgi:hypothetical protein
MSPRVSNAAGCLVLFAAAAAFAAPPAPSRIDELCRDADGPAHCGRLLEAEQLKAFPNLAVRDGDTLKVLLFPSGTRELVDVDTIHGARTYALWDYWSRANAVVLFRYDVDHIAFAVLQRVNGQLTALPAEPVPSLDGRLFAVADACATGCDNEIAVWRMTRDGARKELAWKPGEPWTDTTVTWKDTDVLAIEYMPKGAEKPLTVTRRLSDPSWQRLEAR